MAHPSRRDLPSPIIVRSGEQHISDETNNAHKWGRAKTFKGPWTIGQVVGLLMLTDITRQNDRRVPQVQNVVLSFNRAVGQLPEAADYIFRWLVTLGGGGGLTKFTIDAASLVQLSLSAETLEIGLLCDSWGPNWPETPAAPSFSVQGACFFADGNTASDAPTYTQRWRIAAGATEVRLVAPYGANGFRILGEPAALGATGPFVPSMLYSLEPTSGGFPLDQFEGEYLEGVRIADVPYPATPSSVLIQNTSGDGLVRNGAIAWNIAL